MEETQDWLESLLSLQETDSRLDRMKEQVEAAPQQKKEAQDNLDTQQSNAVAVKEEVRKKELEISKVNAEIDSIEAHKLKVLEQTNSVKDNATYKALLDEVKSMESQVTAKEDVILDLMEELEERKAVFKGAQGKLKDAINRVEQMMSDLDVRVENCKKQITILEEKRTEQAEVVDEEIFSKYTRLKRSHGGRKVALVEINGDKCGYCHLKLTTQEILQAKKSVALNSCSNCGSLLYS
jgi:uncharacterized protein